MDVDVVLKIVVGDVEYHGENGAVDAFKEVSFETSDVPPAKDDECKGELIVQHSWRKSINKVLPMASGVTSRQLMMRRMRMMENVSLGLNGERSQGGG